MTAKGRDALPSPSLDAQRAPGGSTNMFLSFSCGPSIFLAFLAGLVLSLVAAQRGSTAPNAGTRVSAGTCRWQAEAGRTSHVVVTQVRRG